MSEQQACRHCISMPEPHLKTCHCGHDHNDHVYAGGCKICNGCDRYDQSDHATRVKKETIIFTPQPLEVSKV